MTEADLRQENDALRILRRIAEDRNDMEEAQRISDKIMANWKAIAGFIYGKGLSQ